MTELVCTSDRWTCPQCSRSVVINGCDGDVRAAIRACQDRHHRAHEAAVGLALKRPGSITRPAKGGTE